MSTDLLEARRFLFLNRLRSTSGAGLRDCRHAAELAQWDEDEALKLLRSKGTLREDPRWAIPRGRPSMGTARVK